MTKEKFNNTKFGVGMKVNIPATGETHDLIAIDFECSLLEINIYNEIEPLWIPFDECDIVSYNKI